MPSVRVRRGSQYASLLGEDELQEQNRGSGITRPRSRTLASIYQNSDPLTIVNVEDAQGAQAESSSGPERASRPGDSPPRPLSKVASSILSHQKSSELLRAPRSQDFGSAHRRRPAYASDSRLHDRTLTLEGQQADVIVPNDGRPGVLESQLSFSSAESDPFSNASENSLNHEDDIVEHLDAIDPQIATVSNLANAANAILIPPIGYSRKPVIFLPRVPVSEDSYEKRSGHEDDLDRHVEGILSKRSRIRRTLQGVWAFVKTPIGFITAIYGFCVTLFTVTGVGLIPWRIIDTYRILKIWRCKNLTRKLRQKAGLPLLYDEDDLPDPMYDPNYVHVLSEEQEKELHHHQKQFMKSQTWYRPHGTPTHRAFPIDTALLICFLIDGNSVFQCILCGCMWGLNRFERPAWTTGSLIPASFLCGIFSAVFIWRGSQKTRRTKEVEERLRLALTLEKHPDKFRAVEAAKATGQNMVNPSVPGNRSRTEAEAARANSPDKSHRISSIYIEEKMEVPPDADSR